MFVVLRIQDPHAYDAMPLTDKPDDLMTGQDPRAVLAGVQHVGRRQTKRIHGAVRDFYCTRQCRINRRFDAASEGRVNGLRLNSRGLAGGNES